MLDDGRRFVRLELEAIDVGFPLRFAIFDGNRRVVCDKGSVVATPADAEKLCARGVYRLVTSGVRLDLATPESVVADVPAGRAAESGASATESETEARTQPRTTEQTLETSHIRVGDPLLLQTAPEAPKLTARLIGYLKNRSVIITQPEVNGELAMLREGQAFTARFFSGKSVYEFATTILKQTSVPYPLLHLAYPRDLKVQEIRRSPRVPVDVIVAIESAAGQASGRLLDLGKQGCGLCARTVLGQKGEMLRLKFKLTVEGVDSYLVLNGEIRNVIRRENEQPMPYLHGLSFSEIEGNSQLALAAYVFGHLLGDI